MRVVSNWRELPNARPPPSEPGGGTRNGVAVKSDVDEAPHRKRMKRIDRVGDVRFVTFSCYQRLPLLGHPRIRDAFVDTLGQHRERTSVRVLGYVVMPEHVHLLLLPPPELPEITSFLHGVKYTFAQRVIKRWRENDAAILRSRRCGRRAQVLAAWRRL